MRESTGGLNPIVFTCGGTASSAEATLSTLDHVGNSTDGQMSMVSNVDDQSRCEYAFHGVLP